MKEETLKLLEQSERSLKIEEISDLIGLNSPKQLKELIDALNELEKDIIIYRSKKGKYLLFEKSHLKKGRIVVHKSGFGFVLMENEPDIRVEAANMNGAIHNDIVIVENVNEHDGKVIKVISREKGRLVGEYFTKEEKGYIKLDNEKYKIEVEIDSEDNKGVVEGHKVLVEILGETKKGKFKGKIIKILGHKNDPGIDILSIINEYGLNDTFSDEVIEEVEKVSTKVKEEELRNRRDLRKDIIFTIDGDDAKDLDDAVSLKVLENGNYLLGVHIADVSYYVKEDSYIDKEAYDRATSVYLVDRVIPMLPHKLSNGICSLNEKVDRLTVTCEMEINEKGNVVNYDIYESVINSQKRMTYRKVNDFLEKKSIPEGYEAFAKELSQMETLANILRKNKEERGYLDFEIDEMKIVVNNEGEPVDIIKRERGIAEKIVEDFMIIANETVATHIFYLEYPFLYRIHEYPKEAKINSFIEFISILGYKIKGKPKDFHPKAMQGILESLKDKKEFLILANLLLRSMQKAVYNSENKGHYGLASKCYTHFTSPIRRYPDTTVHRLLRTYVFNKENSMNVQNYWQKKLIPLCEHSSIKERDAIECERAVESLKAAEYMKKHIGEKYEGIISSVMSFGMFIQLENLIEGLVKVSNIDDDYYYFDEKTYSFIGRKHKKTYRIGDKVLVEVENASKEQRNIDFKVLKKM